jgi:predicted nuclease of restriction endonuclease-like (RecB) superfamily
LFAEYSEGPNPQPLPFSHREMGCRQTGLRVRSLVPVPRLRAAQVRAALSVNAHLVGLYWQVGHRIAQQQAKEGWGAGVIPRLAADLHAEFPEMKGFSERNLNYMIHFAREYGAPAILQQPAALLPEGGATPIVPQAAPQLSEDDPSRVLQQLAAKLPWFHHVILMEKVKDRSTRLWYMQHAIEHGWSRAVLTVQIETQAHRRTVEYALRDMKKPIGVAEWKTRLVESLPKQLRGALPSVEDLEKGLAGDKP